MSNLPAGWEQKKLGEIAFVTKLAGFEFTKYVKYSDASEIPVIRAQNVTKSGFQDGNFHYVSREILEALPRSRVRGGEILMVFVGSVGNVGLVPEGKDYFLGPNVAKIKIENERVFNKFILYFLMSDEGKASVNGFSKSTTQSSISMGSIREVLAPIPPLNEQKRIVKKLDTLLARVDSCETHLERVPQILKRFRQSVLAKAISGDLTADWRGSETTENWIFERADDVCEKVQSGGTPREGFIDKAGIPFLKVYNIVDQKVDFHYRPQYITKEIQTGSMSKSQTKPGDVLMNIVGPPLGKVAIVSNEFSDWNINQAITLFRPNERITSKWIYYFLCSGYSIAEIVHETRGSAGQTNISLSQCRDFIFSVPPLEEQAEIVRRVEKLFAYAERLEARYMSASEHVERLTPSLLAKAFRGELVEREE